MNAIYMLVVLIMFVIIYNYYDVTETCSFARWCHEGRNNNIIPSFYFYQMYECPKYSNWLIYDYLEQSTTGTMKCEETLYGYCNITTNICEDAIEAKHSYSMYQMSINMGRSHWIIFVPKKDEKGTNCPTIEDIIYKVSNNNNMFDYVKNFMILNTLYLFVIIIIFAVKYKKITSYHMVDNVNLKASV